MLTPIYDKAGALIGVTIHSTTYSEAALLALVTDRERLVARIVIQDAFIADLRAQIVGLLDLLGQPSVPRVTTDERGFCG